MAGLSYSEYLKSKESGVSKKTTAGLSYSDYIANKNKVAEPSTISKVGGFVKDVAVDIGKTLTYTPQRLAQAGMAIGGMSPEAQDIATKKVLGPLAMPVPTKLTPTTVMKEAGRAVQLPALAMPVTRISQALRAGGVMALGQGMERQDLLSKEGLTTAAGTVGFTAAIPIVGKQLGKVFGKKSVPEVGVNVPASVVPPVAPPVAPTPISRVLGRGEVPPVEPGTIKISQVIEKLKQTNVTAKQGEAILKELSQNNPTGQFTKAEIVSAFQNNLPQNTKGIMGNFKKGKVAPTEPAIPPVAKAAPLSPVATKAETVAGETVGVPKQTINITEKESSRAFESVSKTGSEAFDPKTVKESYSAFKETLDVNPKMAEEIATGKVTDPRINKSWALSWMENHADDTGDIELATRLAQSDTFSVAGQELFGASLRQEDTAASIIREIRLDKLRKAGVGKTAKEAIAKAKAEEASFLKTLKKELSNKTEEFIKVIKCK